MNPTDVLLTVNGSPIANPLTLASRSDRDRDLNSVPGPSRSMAHAGTPASSSRLYSMRERQPTSAGDNDEDEDERDDGVTGEDGGDNETGDQDDSDGELPDPEAYERHLQSQASRLAGPKSAPSRPTKRAPSLIFRQSLGPNAPLISLKPKDPAKSYVYLNNHEIEFDPLGLNREGLNDELDEKGLDAKDKMEVGKLVQAEVCRVLQARMESWRINTE